MSDGMKSRILRFEGFDITATYTSGEWSLRAGDRFSIEHSAGGTTPTGTWTAEHYNEAVGAWATWTDLSAEFTNPAAATASGVANAVNPPAGRWRFVYTYSSGGSATGGDAVVKIN